MHTVHRHLIDRVASMTAIIALGTHSYMEPDEIDRWFSVPEGSSLAETYPGLTVLNHEFLDPDQIVKIGTLSADRVHELSNGSMREEVVVEMNRHVVELTSTSSSVLSFRTRSSESRAATQVLHPGAPPTMRSTPVALGRRAPSTSDMIGKAGVTPVRAIVNAGSRLIPGARLALCLVVQSGSGEIEVGRLRHRRGRLGEGRRGRCRDARRVRRRAVHEVLAMMPTATTTSGPPPRAATRCKPAMADGGEVIIYAPHVTEVSEQHPRSTRSATTPSSTSRSSGTSSRTCRRASSPTRPTSAERLVRPRNEHPRRTASR